MSNQFQINEHCLKSTPYKGFVSIWCGDGSVVFKNQNGEEVKGCSNSRSQWLEPAWLQAKAEIDRRTETH